MKAVSAKLEKAMDTQLKKMQQLVTCSSLLFYQCHSDDIVLSFLRLETVLQIISLLLLKPQVRPVTVGVVEMGVVDTGARVYTALSGWLGVLTGISAASTGDVLVRISLISVFCH